MQNEAKPIRLSIQGKWIAVGIIAALTILLFMNVQHVLSPFIAAIITAYLFNPLVGWLDRRTGIGRALWIIVLYVLAFALLYNLGTLVWPRLIAQYDGLVNQVPNIVATIQQQFQGLQEITIGGIVVDLNPLEEQIIKVVSEVGSQVPTAVPGLVFSALETVVYVLVYLIVTFYLLLQAEQLVNWAYGLVPAPYRVEIRALGHEIDRVLAAYIRGQLLLILIMSVLLYIPLSIMGLRYALVIAIISGVLEIIPFIGPWSAAAIAISVALIQNHAPFGLSGVTLAGVIALIYLVLRLLEDNVIIPTVVGHFVKLHPALIIFAVLAGAALAGSFGLLVAIPVAAVIRILLAYLYRKLVDASEPIQVTIEPPPPESHQSLVTPPHVVPPPPPSKQGGKRVSGRRSSVGS